MSKTYVEVFQFADKLDKSHCSFKVHLDGAFESFVKFHGGRRVEDNGNIVA